MSYFKSSIGRKQIMGVAGLAFSLFTLTHMLGNTLIFKGSDAFNSYAHAIITNPLLPVAEIGLVVIFLLHTVLGIWLSIENKAARKTKYALPTNGEKSAEFASKSMKYQGIVIFIFVVYHLATFKYGPHYTTTVNGVEMRDLYKLVFERFSEPLYAGFYIVCMGVLGMHLSHGFSSAFQTMGLNHPMYTPKIRILSILFSLLVAIGFAAQPLYVLLNH